MQKRKKGNSGFFSAKKKQQSTPLQFEHGLILIRNTDKDRLLLKHQWLDRRFQREDNDVVFMHVQRQHYLKWNIVTD